MADITSSEPTAVERLLLGLVRAGDAPDLAAAQSILAAAVTANELKARTDGTILMARQHDFAKRAPKYGLARWGITTNAPAPPADTPREAELRAELAAMKEAAPGRSDEQRVAASDRMNVIAAELLEIDQRRAAAAKAAMDAQLRPLRDQLAGLNAQKPYTDAERCERADKQAELLAQIEKIRHGNLESI